MRRFKISSMSHGGNFALDNQPDLTMTRFGGFFIAQGKTMSDLKILFPEQVVVQVKERRVEIKPVRFCDFELFGRVSGSMVALLQNPGMEGVAAYSLKRKELNALLRKTTSLSAWAIWRLPAAVAVELAVLVVQVNSSFFDQALVNLAGVLLGQTQHSN
jgi:hypothetical protein